jgi:hypothetical protein
MEAALQPLVSRAEQTLHYSLLPHLGGHEPLAGPTRLAATTEAAVGVAAEEHYRGQDGAAAPPFC